MKTYKKISKKKAKELVKKIIGHSAKLVEHETEYVADIGMCRLCILKDAEREGDNTPWHIFCWMFMFAFHMTYLEIDGLNGNVVVKKHTGMICFDYDTLELIDPATLKIE